MDKELKIPTVGEYVRNIGKLVKVETIQPPPPPPYTDYIFESITAKCEVRLNGNTLKELYELYDYYGLGSSIESAIEEMKTYVHKQNITPQNGLEVVVIKKVSQCRYRKLNRESIYNKGFVDFDYKEYGSQYNVPKPSELVVWSSKTGEVK